MIQWAELNAKAPWSLPKTENTRDKNLEPDLVWLDRLISLISACLLQLSIEGKGESEMVRWLGAMSGRPVCLWRLIHALITNPDLHSQTKQLSSTTRGPLRRFTLVESTRCACLSACKVCPISRLCPRTSCCRQSALQFHFPFTFLSFIPLLVLYGPKIVTDLCFFFFSCSQLGPTRPLDWIPPPRLTQ